MRIAIQDSRARSFADDGRAAVSRAWFAREAQECRRARENLRAGHCWRDAQTRWAQHADDLYVVFTLIDLLERGRT